MMERCIALAMRAMDLGEYPYAAVICREGMVICESTSSAAHEHDVTHHAEVVAISEALRRLNRVSLEDCTIYANAEPCALCSYAMRERIGRVVFGVPAPLTGGVTRWNILTDIKLSDTVPCSGPGSLNRFSASLSGVSAGVRLPCSRPSTWRTVFTLPGRHPQVVVSYTHRPVRMRIDG
jgi:tRNA(Arg) A34 adenosine deaminase TadA